ncbi:MAG: hypothetical protein HYR51_03240 [Candidatus Rokubacteria bacterium]|nr:hypothetical protein [Candidatus Rokubacteria bacterium]
MSTRVVGLALAIPALTALARAATATVATPAGPAVTLDAHRTVTAGFTPQ